MRRVHHESPTETHKGRGVRLPCNLVLSPPTRLGPLGRSHSGRQAGQESRLTPTSFPLSVRCRAPPVPEERPSFAQLFLGEQEKHALSLPKGRPPEVRYLGDRDATHPVPPGHPSDDAGRRWGLDYSKSWRNCRIATSSRRSGTTRRLRRAFRGEALTEGPAVKPWRYASSSAG